MFLEDSKTDAHFYLFKYSQEVLIIPEAGVATKSVEQNGRPLEGWMLRPGKGKVNLQIEIEDLEMGIVLPTNCL